MSNMVKETCHRISLSLFFLFLNVGCINRPIPFLTLLSYTEKITHCLPYTNEAFVFAVENEKSCERIQTMHAYQTSKYAPDRDKKGGKEGLCILYLAYTALERGID